MFHRLCFSEKDDCKRSSEEIAARTYGVVLEEVFGFITTFLIWKRQSPDYELLDSENGPQLSKHSP
jgi:hypothetical protein